MLETALIYSLLVFISVVGLLQASGSYNGSALFTFFKEKYLVWIFAALTTGGSLIAFFTWNYWGQTGVIEGGQQFGLFLLSALLAVIFTGGVSWLIRTRVFRRAIVRIVNRESAKPAANTGLASGKDGGK